MNNSLIQLIKTRRSIRQYEDKEIDEDTIKEIIEAGKYAPSAENRQPWKFIVITNKKLIQELSNEIKKQLTLILRKRFIKKTSLAKELKDQNVKQFISAIAYSEEDKIFFNAPVVVFIVTEDKPMYDESCACCAQNIMLAAHSKGIGSCWIGFAHIIDEDQTIIDKIGIPKNHHISATITLGYPKGKPKIASYRKVGSDIINWIK